MKYDILKIEELASEEAPAVQSKIKRRRRLNILDLVVVQMLLCAAISTVVLTARTLTVSASGKTPNFGIERAVEE